MGTLNKILFWINSSRKLFVTVAALIAVQFITISLCALNIFLAEPIVSLTEVVTGSFTADGIIVGAYCATNVGSACVKGVMKWLNRKK